MRNLKSVIDDLREKIVSDSLKDSLTALEAKYEEKAAKLSSIQDEAISSNSIDKLIMEELRAK